MPSRVAAHSSLSFIGIVFLFHYHGAQVPALGSVSIVVVLAVFFFAILGMQMFGGKFCVSEQYNAANYDNFFRSTLSVFAVITLDDWPAQMYNAVKGTSGLAVTYFIALIVVCALLTLSQFSHEIGLPGQRCPLTAHTLTQTWSARRLTKWLQIGNFIVFNLLLAVMLTCFEKPVHVLEETEEEKLLKDLGDLTKGQGFMMSWEIAQSKLQQAEARVEQALVHAITVRLTDCMY